MSAYARTVKDAVKQRLSQEQLELFWRLRWRALVAARGLGARACHRLDGELERIAVRNGLMFDTRPTAAEVVSRYARGWVLFGLPSGRGFEWRSSPTRVVITAETAEVPKRIQGPRRRLALDVRFGGEHAAIIEQCRAGREGWLTDELVDVYRDVDELGFLSSVGAYQDGVLVAGLWGLTIGGTFGIMSMFHTIDHAGSIVLATLSEAVAGGDWSTVDCGWPLRDTFRRLGAYEVSNAEFCERIWRDVGSRPGPGADLLPAAAG